MIDNMFSNMDNLGNMDFSNTEIRPFLLGLLSAFDNRYQACADKFFKEITWKQFFAIICINLCEEAPTLNELANIMGTSHQNLKQILIKLEKVGFVEFKKDDSDKRKQRITLTDKCKQFCAEHEEGSQQTISKIFEGIDDIYIAITVKTIMAMEANLNNLDNI